ncbi:hypothetical protein GECvBMG_gp271 [Salmonella phage GEC_vB_MG]|uniref:Uncharacterized protein 234 n=2 Tax=Seunavirus TaxID=1914851 RepID=G3BMA0_9CAUD|nr:hypothetical protein PVP-SE1_gp234 [Salmonella phage PVPSE1]YP_009148891.1 hypothetical protein ACQ19_gp095 [Salmonella phage SSE121]ADP02630.1 hypothetical protein [Salmonella phage PVPSE1]AFU63736.1 hypothetical protein [Salmonella phage SSE121]QPI14815.1 hypothetical protein GECvBMG_gp271 [Salmonella phage GEC_vB_MG]
MLKVWMYMQQMELYLHTVLLVAKKYALILMTDEDPRDDVDNLVKANEWIESLGWKHEGDD